MPTRAHDKSEIALAIGHVLLIDIVGYSKLLINEQTEAMKTLNEVVRSSACFRNADAARQLIRLPTGDGMALVFHEHVDAPATCAMQIAAELKRFPEIRVRMGIHSGAINQILDVNNNSNVAGAGIDMAQRVMDCGDAGHILLSKRVADDLAPYPQWQHRLHDLGEVKVKHGIQLGIVNLYTADVGNAACPAKILGQKQAAKSSRRRLWSWVALGIFVLAALGFFLFWLNRPLPEKSVAVLPFQNLSDDPANAYFAHGIENEILTRLAKISDLKVISQTSTQQYKETPKNIRTIARELGVAQILEGSVQKIGDAVRINVQLIRARDDWHVWADSYDRKLIDVLGVETEVARQIASQLRASLTGREEKALDLKLTDNTKAYDAYVLGSSFEGHGGFSPESLQAKLKAYGTAVELDPQFAQAWARLSSAHAWLYFTDDHTAQRLTKAKEALEHAQHLAPEEGEVLMALGNVRYLEQDWQGALEAYKKAADALPNNTVVLVRIGGVLRRLGQWEEALSYHTRASQLDPRNAETWQHLALTFRGLRRYDDALDAFDHALEAAPGDARLISEKATTLQMKGDLPGAAQILDTLPTDADRGQTTPWRFNQWIDERNYAPAIAALQSILEKRADFPKKSGVAETLSNLGYVEMLNGERDSASRHLTEARDLIEEVRGAGGENPYDILAFGAEIYSLLGDHATAEREVERAAAALAKDALLYPQALTAFARVQVEAGENDQAIETLTRVLKMNCAYGATPGLLRLEPVWDPLRNDPRFQRLVEESR